MRALITAIAVLALAACGETVEEEQVTQQEEEVTYPGLPEELRQGIIDAGQVIDGATIAPLADYVDAPPYDDVTVEREISYGEGERRALDIYTYNQAADGQQRPVLIFVHGGGFVGGRKAGDFYPDNIGAWAARNGMVGVNTTYRFAPDNPWPAGRDDLAATIQWVRQNIAQYGGDPDNIILFGHSAGGNHVADYVTHAELQGPEAAGIQGAVLLSPYYSSRVGPPDYTGDAEGSSHPYYGDDEQLQTAEAAMARLGASPVPLFLAYAQYDPQRMIDFAREVESRLCGDASSGACPEVVYLPHHNHLTEGAAIGSVDQSLTGPMLAWIRSL